MDFLNRLLHRERVTMVERTTQRPVNPLTYPKASEPFNDELFQSPTSEYRGAPFWAWNNKLDKDQLLRQIDNFADMGMGGFHIHTRTGLDTEYLGEEYMDIVKACVNYAEQRNMLACLYDEDRWPSGPAGGRVMKDHPEHKVKHLLFTKHKYGTVDLGGTGAPSRADAARSEEGSLIATFDIELDRNGNLVNYRVLNSEDVGKNIWYAYVEPNRGSSWFNGYTYVDSLSPKAMARFIEVTHEVFKSKVGDKFGTVIPNVFTDEPQFTTKTRLSNPRGEEDVFMPWTTDLPDTLKSAYSSDLVAHIPELFWNLQDWKPSLARYQYHDHVTERFVTAFMDQLSAWCRSNNLILNGHMMEEPTLWQQTTAIGEAMRCYRNMDLPGMDLLLDRVEYNTAKQCVSVARQNGIRGALSEIYGVTHWYFTFEGHKGCGDWQAALGITFRVQHLTWVSMEGESKRDYPASIGYQSPWYKEYPYIEDHFARVAVAMTRGQAVSRVAVMHPIESFWLAFGPNGSTDEQGRRDTLFAELTNWLLQGLIDFDFISESLLPTQSPRIVNKKLHVGHCAYDVVILPNLRTVRSSTLSVMNDFLKQGGNVLIAGSAPDLVDADATKTPPIFNGATNVFWEQHLILGALETYREIRVTNQADANWNRLLYQMRQDADERYVFICNTDRNAGADTTIKLKGSWLVKELDTLTGQSGYINASHNKGWTSFPYHFNGCGSALFRLSPEVSPRYDPNIFQQVESKASADTQVTLKSVTLSEPNVLVLDFAQWRLSTADAWSARTEILRLENDIRSHFKLALKGSAVAQPYTIPVSDRKPVATVSLRLVFTSAVTLKSKKGDLKLALENASNTKITFNGSIVPISTTENSKNNYWVDEAISTIDLPGDIVISGENIVELEFPFNTLSSTERIYLLGNFAIQNTSPSPSISGPLDTSKLTWGSLTTQSLPFYVGNITYTCTFTVPPISSSTTSTSHHHHHRKHLPPPTKSNITLLIPHFSSPVLAIHNHKTGEKLGRIAFQPRTLDLGEYEEGEYDIDITAYGNRYNSFGHFHLEDGRTGDCGPELWRTQGDWWTDEYRVKDIGVLKCPTIVITPVTAAGSSEKKIAERTSTSSMGSWEDVRPDAVKEL